MFVSRILFLSLFVLPMTACAAEKSPPQVGEKIADVELPTLTGEKVKLSEAAQQGQVVVVVLRGYPGYQCPICRRQVQQFFNAADQFASTGTQVLMIYPGDVDDLAARAKQFLGSQKVPDGFQFLLDPGYRFTNSWNLRWDEERETAYPSTFIVGKDLKVRMAKVSKSHGGRTSPEEILKTLAEDKWILKHRGGPPAGHSKLRRWSWVAWRHGDRRVAMCDGTSIQHAHPLCGVKACHPSKHYWWTPPS